LELLRERKGHKLLQGDLKEFIGKKAMNLREINLRAPRKELVGRCLQEMSIVDR
jgi:hypothetical protein